MAEKQSCVEAKRVKQRELLAASGYTVQTQGACCWWALMPGETQFKDDGKENQNYLGFFSSENDLLDEIAGEIESQRAKEIQQSYQAGGRQSGDAERAVNRLKEECASLFEDDRLARSFLLDETHEKPSSHNAYQATEEDVANVLASNVLAVANTNGKSFAAMAAELLAGLDHDLIEEVALFGDDLDEQTDYANDEIARQLREAGVLEPLKSVEASQSFPSESNPG